MTQPRAFVSRLMHQDAIDLIGEATDMEVWPDDPPPSAEELRARLANADGVLINIMDRVDAALLDSAPKLRVVSQLAAGLDNVDVAECTRRGILVGSTPGILSKAVADHAMALLLSAARRVVESDKWVRGNNWELAFHPTYWLGNEVQSSTLGIVGSARSASKWPDAPTVSICASCTIPAIAAPTPRSSTASPTPPSTNFCPSPTSCPCTAPSPLRPVT